MGLVRRKNVVGLKLHYWPTRLTADDLRELQSWVIRVADHAPTFAAWFVGMLQDEELRRLNREPAEPAYLPLDWSGAALGLALTHVTTLVRHAESDTAQKFCDAVLQAVAAAAAAKLLDMP
jgi:hypothetical protein